MIQAIFSAVVVCLALDQVHSQGFGFPQLGMGGFGGGLGGTGFSPLNPFGGQFGNLGNFGNQLQQQMQQQQQNVLTCINNDRNDPSSFIRFTITEHLPLGQGQAMFGQQGNEAPKEWLINGYYKPSSVTQISGSFQVLVTQYGRVNDGCNAVALGPAITSLNPFGNNPMNPFLNFGNNNFGQTRRAGQLQNPLMVTQGGLTIYSDRLQGVSRSQLVGGGIAVCPQVGSGGECYGIVLQCCTIANDQVPASEMYVTPGGQQQGGLQGGFGAGGFGNGGFNGGLGNGGFNGGIGNGGFNGGIANAGFGLGGPTIPFNAINSGSVLSLTDPNAGRNPLAASSAGTSNNNGASADNSAGLF
ncbi:uncharacterized PPE family protein PPE12-like [Littorina saxatilis]|uniref:uncharacterized PPE family protein PPE12-like n=1 Tax=Littorina saxatilis TaxID=31220 RepID=UPI0038B5DC34